MAVNTVLAFLKRRVAEERLAASITNNAKARDVHADLALLCEARIRLLADTVAESVTIAIST